MFLVVTDSGANDQVHALPDHALALYAELRVVLEVSPWSGESINRANPDAPVRQMTFGHDHEGLVTYLVADRQREVHILAVQWLGGSS
ncbi:hypothetical protein [Nocardia amamiensis]|uniref:hypothetical protein n=1 Tax=Nocardia amamiensis TaxID=404578 RepID=UPI000832DA55|nr:hypothetical protein [Nocardia amamiensis]